MKYFLIFMLAACSAQVVAEAQIFGLVAKSTSDPNFVLAWQACDKAARGNGDFCELLGSSEPANAHLQARAIESALTSDRYAAIAVSVTQSSFIADRLTQASIPVMTFDSPFKKEEKLASLPYVGADNEAFGRDLGRLALATAPEAGSICIMTVDHDPNLAIRVDALRRYLAGDHPLKSGQRLSGQGGWTEPTRCPKLPNAHHREALHQLTGILRDIQPDLLVSVGHWPIVNERAFIATMSALGDEQLNTQIIAGVGKISTGHREMLRQGLLQGLVSIDFEDMGRLVYEQLRYMVKGEAVSPVTYTKSILVPAQSPSADQALKEE